MMLDRMFLGFPSSLGIEISLGMSSVDYSNIQKNGDTLT